MTENSDISEHRLPGGDLTLSSKDKFHLTVTGWTINTNVESITKISAFKELEETKYLFTKMINVSQDLSDFKVLKSGTKIIALFFLQSGTNHYPVAGNHNHNKRNNYFLSCWYTGG